MPLIPSHKQAAPSRQIPTVARWTNASTIGAGAGPTHVLAGLPAALGSAGGRRHDDSGCWFLARVNTELYINLGERKVSGFHIAVAIVGLIAILTSGALSERGP